MGTYGGYHSRNEIVNEVTKTYENDQQVQTVVAKKFVGNNLWCVFERVSKAAPTDIERFIIVFLIRRYYLGNGNAEWTYKPVDESMGPCEHSCPLSFLDAVPHPFPNGYPEGYGDWRAAVRAYHARRNQKLEVGQVIKLTNGETYTVSKVGRKVLATQNGVVYKIPRRMLLATDGE